jgi:hypothetical protein
VKKLLKHAGLQDETAHSCLAALKKVQADTKLLNAHFKKNYATLFATIKEVDSM